jgi:hypothetical protein
LKIGKEGGFCSVGGSGEVYFSVCDWEKSTYTEGQVGELPSRLRRKVFWPQLSLFPIPTLISPLYIKILPLNIIDIL